MTVSPKKEIEANEENEEKKEKAPRGDLFLQIKKEYEEELKQERAKNCEGIFQEEDEDSSNEDVFSSEGSPIKETQVLFFNDLGLIQSSWIRFL